MSEPLTDADFDPLTAESKKSRRQRPAPPPFEDPEPPPTKPRASHRRGAGETARLRRELKKGATALSLIPFMATGTADRLADPRITAVIEAKAEAFADSWVAVAEVSPFVKQNLTLMLNGGVWVHAALQTAALGYSVAVFAGVTPLSPAALMFMPEMRQFTFQAAPEAQPGNGTVPPEQVPTPDGTEGA